MANNSRPQAENLYGFPQPSVSQNPPTIIAKRDPTTNDTGYALGTMWDNTVAGSIWSLSSVAAGAASWVGLGGGAAGVDTVNSLLPTAGNIIIAGTAAQIGVANAGSTVTLSTIGPYTPATYTAHGVLIGEAASSIVATAAGATNSVLQGSTGADPSFTTTPTVASLTTTGAITAGTGVTATTGNISATAGAVNAGTSMTATLGNITATNGNLVLGTAGNKLVIHGTTAASDSVGTTAVMSGTPGTVTVTSGAVTASSVILFSRATTGGTPGQVSISAQAGGSFTLLSTGNETSTFNYLIIN